jgi:pantetheine-phosphate adenylyltransferase
MQIRGIRSYADFDSEFSMGIINRKLSGKETVFLMASSSRVHISSTRIRELAMFGRKLENFVPDEIQEEVYAQLFEHYKKIGLVKESAKVKNQHH